MCGEWHEEVVTLKKVIFGSQNCIIKTNDVLKSRSVLCLLQFYRNIIVVKVRCESRKFKFVYVGSDQRKNSTSWVLQLLL